MSRKEVINTFKVAAQSNCKFLYLSPERLETALFREWLPALDINLIAVDEAHCISQWGYDFRPPYLRIAAIREELPAVPVLALTASATEPVQNDICDKLGFPDKNIFRQSFERPRLSYSCFKLSSRISKIIGILQKVPGSSIIYCRSRKKTSEICDLLKMQGIRADYYHAGLSSEERSRKQEAWLQDQAAVMVCTNAFGMGIDKPNVRTVIHADLPDCLESYYQEAGRAGRDGKTAYAVLLYDEPDLKELRQSTELRFPDIEKIREVYQSVANYLQVPSGEGQGQYYDFDISDFLKKFRHSSSLVVHALKALEQEGWLSFNEQVFLSSSVQVIAGKELLFDFENSHPELEPCIKTLLRTYGGILDQPIHISEKTLGWLMKKEPEKVKMELNQLNSFGIIEYDPQKDSPQLFFLRPRIKATDLQIDRKAFESRKEVYNKRVLKMLAYLEEKGCRSRFIAGYFGDHDIKPCGVCDNCLKIKSASLSGEEFENLHHRIINIISHEPLHSNELFEKLNDIKKEKAWKVLEFLQQENKIELDAAGRIQVSRKDAK
jgi:ATP-dependent DNA helicase RecQ